MVTQGIKEHNQVLLGVDIGTTNCKAGVFGLNGEVIHLTRRTTTSGSDSDGRVIYPAERLWHDVVECITEAVLHSGQVQVVAIGISSMAETGLLVDRKSGVQRSEMLPWFDTTHSKQAEFLASQSDPLERFVCSGIRPTFKCSLAKILGLREQDRKITQGAVWLCVADYIAYRLTGEMVTDPTLAGRTFAFRIDKRTWDEGWLAQLELEPGLFPTVLASGEAIGSIRKEQADMLGLAGDIPVCIAGHDHVTASLGVGAIVPGRAFDSMGTAEPLIGVFPERLLQESDFRSGLMFGCHVLPGLFYWMGGLSASGGSIDWLRRLMGDPPLSYEELDQLLAQVGPNPSGILYYPYLIGSESPNPDPRAKGAFLGLSLAHTRGNLIKAVLEGTSFEIEAIRRAAESLSPDEIDTLLVAGGGTRSGSWLQIKADICGCTLYISPIQEATVLGAAMLAGIGCGLFDNAQQAINTFSLDTMKEDSARFVPDPFRHEVYQSIFKNSYRKFQAPLREIGK